MAILHVRVFDAYTRRGIPFATVIVVNKSTGVKYPTSTDVNGYARIKIPDGYYHIMVRVFNYEPYDVDIPIKGEYVLDVPLRMVRL